MGLTPSFLSMVVYLCLLRERSMERSKIQINKYIVFLSDYHFLYKIYYHYKMLLSPPLSDLSEFTSNMRRILPPLTPRLAITIDWFLLQFSQMPNTWLFSPGPLSFGGISPRTKYHVCELSHLRSIQCGSL